MKFMKKITLYSLILLFFSCSTVNKTLESEKKQKEIKRIEPLDNPSLTNKEEEESEKDIATIQIIKVEHLKKDWYKVYAYKNEFIKCIIFSQNESVKNLKPGEIIENVILYPIGTKIMLGGVDITPANYYDITCFGLENGVYACRESENGYMDIYLSPNL